MVINCNLTAMYANRQLGITTKELGKTTEKLSSGYRINRAADDAAGLAISEKMRSQIRGLSRASQNAQEAISLIQTAEGAMHEVHAMLQRGRELAVGAATGTMTDEDRRMTEDEIRQLKEAITAIGRDTEFNTMPLFPGNGASPEDALWNISKYEITLGKNGEVTVATEDGEVPGSILAEKIATELIPNAAKQLMDTFQFFRDVVGQGSITIELEIGEIDGEGGDAVAYAQMYSYSTIGSLPSKQLIKVDLSDYDDADALGTGDKAEALEATILHELMHTAMQYTLTDGMSGRGGNYEKFPKWFTEGAAEFASGSADRNMTIVYTLASSKTEQEKKAAIETYLKSDTVDNNPYGFGYLACTYMSWLAAGKGAVTKDNLVSGMDSILNALKTDAADQTGNFSGTLQNVTGKTEAELKAAIENADAEVVNFMYDLFSAIGNGDGAMAADSLTTGGFDIVGDSADVNQAIKVDPDKITVDPSGSDELTGSLQAGEEKNALIFQIGANWGQTTGIILFEMTAESLKLKNTNVTTQEDAGKAITEFQNAINAVSKVRSYYGAMQNRLEHTIANLDNTAENLQSAESGIRDADMASEIMKMSKYNILQQAGQTMLAQANQSTEGVLALL